MGDIKYSDYRDTSTAGRGLTVKEAIDASPYASILNSAAVKMLAACGPFETVTVSYWYAPFVYLEVRDERQRHPSNMRCLVSFDLTNGKFASAASANKYAFARKGWGAFMDRLAGYKVARYTSETAKVYGGAA